VLKVEKEMAENGRVHPDCMNASNPYHECGVACLERISQGKRRKEKKQSGNCYCFFISWTLLVKLRAVDFGMFTSPIICISSPSQKNLS
jgi:hypothetical protein